MLILPKDAAGPVPVAIFQHGINGDRSTMLLVADDYAARGYATFGIDIPWHGSRQPGAVDKITNLTGAPGADGIGDPKGSPVSSFFDFSGDPAAGIAALDARIMRDNFRQATVDLMQAIRLAAHGDWSEVAGVVLDGGHLVYTAASFGSILGANVMAVDPTVETAVLAAPGGGLFLDLVPNSATLGPLLPTLFAGLLDHAVDVDHPESSPPRAQMSLALLQTLFEPGDALALAGEASPGQSLLFLEAFNDEVVPNHAAESLAAAWGASQVQIAGSPATRIVPLPAVPAPYEGPALRALVQLAPATHGFFAYQDGQRTVEDGGPPFVKLAAPSAVDNPIERAHTLALDFMVSARQGTATVGASP